MATLSKKRIQFSLITLLFGGLSTSLIAMLIRPCFVQPREWEPFSLMELDTQRQHGRMVVVYFRDDWWNGFDILQKELVTLRTESALYNRRAIAMIANQTLNSPDAKNELIRISGSSFVPALAIYPSDQTMPPILLQSSIAESSLLEALSQTQ